MRKLFLFAAPVLAAIPVSAPVFAEDAPKAAPSASPAASESGTPQAQVKNFFQMLTEGRVEAAYDDLLKGTKIAESPKDVAMLKEKTRVALRAFGDVSGVDQLDVKNVGTRLRRITSLSLGSRFPVRWRFYFYQAQEKWNLVDIRIDDRLSDMFEEPAPVFLPMPAAAPAPTAAPAPSASRGSSRAPAR
ncbi:MAG: hypothetical protein PHQ12_02945 [Chthoniobacteraceae bacterium]|nr:hypothetical protein [Chthoniobacteraceae bacterium]